MQVRNKISKQLLVRLGLLFLVFWLPVIIFAQLADSVIDHSAIPGDVATLDALRRLATPWLTDVMIFISNVGNAALIISVTILGSVLLFYRYHHRRQALVLLFGVGGAGAANILLKALFGRTRPTEVAHLVSEQSYSFPSGHAMGSSALAFSIIVILWHSRYRWPAVLLGGLYTLAIGLSRLYLGVHYPSDVIAGWCISLAWVLLVSSVISGYPFRSVYWQKLTFTRARNNR
ncbi:MAG: acid phosphatase [Candidatus Saccharibacteria bacterium]|nr:acid phosphatase [Candidatus Saccharibacteria bacterium]